MANTKIVKYRKILQTYFLLPVISITGWQWDIMILNVKLLIWTDWQVKESFSIKAYTCNPVSTPSRASIITGRYPSQHGAYALGTKLPETELCIGDCLSECGYETALIGKAHFQPLGGTAEYPSAEAYPILQDFDFWKEFYGPFYGFDHVELARKPC